MHQLPHWLKRFRPSLGDCSPLFELLRSTCRGAVNYLYGVISSNVTRS